MNVYTHFIRRHRAIVLQLVTQHHVGDCHMPNVDMGGVRAEEVMGAGCHLPDWDIIPEVEGALPGHT